MSFANASNFAIHNANFTENNNIYVSTGRKALSPVRNVPPSTSRNFTGQEEYLEMLRNHFIKNESPVRKMFLLHGMGGIGKTQICLKFKDEISSIYAYIFWIDATSNDTVEQSLKDIYKMNSSTMPVGVSYSASLVLQWMSTLENKWFMIFDNADGSPEIVENHLPSGNTGNILITSRNPAHQRIVSPENSAELLVMSKDTAIELLLKASGLKDTEKHIQEATDIVAVLHYLPLAIDQAGAYINAGKCSIEKYRSMYEKYRPKLMNNKNFRGASKYNKTVYGTWEISFQKIQEMANYEEDEDLAMAAKYAIALINISAFFHHENISDEIFERAAKHYSDHAEMYKNQDFPTFLPAMDISLLNIENYNEWNELIYRDAVEMLLSFSMIRRTGDSSKFSLHPLVQTWCQDRLPQDQKMLWILNSRAILSSSYGYDFTTSEYLYQNTILIHVLQNVAHGNLNKTPCYIDINRIIQFILVFLRKHEEAEMLAIQSYEEIKSVLGEEHLETLFHMRVVADAHYSLGKYTEAQVMSTQGLEISRRLLGGKHLHTLEFITTLGCTYYQLQRYNESESLLIEALEAYKRIVGENDRHTILCMDSLAVTYEAAGKYREAEELEIHLLEKRRELHGRDHPHTLSSMSDLASIYKKLGKYKEAEILDMEVLEMRKQILGDDHPDTIQAMVHLASTYYELEKYIDEERLELQVLEKRRMTLGEEHPHTIISMSVLAETYRCLGKYIEAVTLETKVLEKRKHFLGEDHLDVIRSMANLARTYYFLGEFSNAQRLYTQVFEMECKILGEEHEDTLHSMANLAITCCDSGNYEEAVRLGIQLVERRKQILGEEHPDTIDSVANLAEYYQCLGRCTEAETFGTEVVEKRRKILGDEHPDTIASMANLAATYWRNDKFAEAEALEIQLLDFRIKNLGQDHVDTIKTMKDLGLTCVKLEKYVEAETLFVEALKAATHVLGKDHKDTLEYFGYVLKIYAKVGKNEEAEVLKIEYAGKSEDV